MKSNKKAEYGRILESCNDLLSRVYAPEKRLITLGQGDLVASVAIVSVSPTQEDILRISSRINATHQVIQGILQTLCLEKSEAYFTHVVKFCPVKKASDGHLGSCSPTREEIALCQPFLSREISLVHPTLIITLGNIALRAATGDDASRISKYHGRAIFTQNAFSSGVACSIFPLFHPACFFDRQTKNSPMSQDLQALGSWVKEMDIL